MNVMAHSTTVGTDESSLGTVSRELRNIADLHEEFFAQFEEKDRGSEGDDEATDDINDNFEDEEEEEGEEYEDDGMNEMEFNYLNDDDNFVSKSIYLDNLDTQDSSNVDQ